MGNNTQQLPSRLHPHFQLLRTDVRLFDFCDGLIQRFEIENALVWTIGDW